MQPQTKAQKFLKARKLKWRPFKVRKFETETLIFHTIAQPAHSPRPLLKTPTPPPTNQQ